MFSHKYFITFTNKLHLWPLLTNRNCDVVTSFILEKNTPKCTETWIHQHLYMNIYTNIVQDSNLHL